MGRFPISYGAQDVLTPESILWGTASYLTQVWHTSNGTPTQ